MSLFVSVLKHPPNRGVVISESTSSLMFLGTVALVVLIDVDAMLSGRHAMLFANDTMVNNWNKILRLLPIFHFDPGCIIV